MRSFTFKLSPTRSQVVASDRLLWVQRELYNAALEERREAWRRGVRRSRVDQFKELTSAMAELPRLAEFGLQMSRGTLWRLDRAFAGFFRRVKAGQAPGFPRFQSRGRFDSVSWPEPVTRKLLSGSGRMGRLRITGIGGVKVRVHRPLAGEPRTLTVRRCAGAWWATIVCRAVPARLLEPTGRQVGVDRGVEVLAATSDGRLVTNPRHLIAAAARLTAAQQALSRTCRRPVSGRRRRARAEVARLHARVARQRKDTLHKLSRVLVNSYDLIALEDLRIPNMTRSAAGTAGLPGTNVAAKAGLNRSILDAGWGILANMIAYKAAEAGRRVALVDPRHTSASCSGCGHVHPEDRVTRGRWRCCACGLDVHADINAARNILHRAGSARDEAGQPAA